MRDKWVLDVLADLRGFAQANAMPMLDEYLSEAVLIAELELANRGTGHGAGSASRGTGGPAKADDVLASSA